MSNAQTTVQTNSTANSIKTIQLEVIAFDKLWRCYPWGRPCHGPYQDQCAARLGLALSTAGVDVRSFHGAMCNVDQPKHMLRAAEVAAWLQRIPFAGCPKPKAVTGKDWQEKVQGKTGIIFFNGYWHRDTDGTGVNSGNHIDLWDGKKLTKSSLADTVATISRFDLGIQSLPMYDPITLQRYNLFSDLRNSHSILFWEIK